MPFKLQTLKQSVSTIFIIFSIATLAVGQGISTSSSSSDLNKAVDQFNTDVAAWNKRCKITKTAAEDAWCKKERARIDARKAELVALGAIKR
jgi:hypothetical protein